METRNFEDIDAIKWNNHDNINWL